jgi:hypothetical protein
MNLISIGNDFQKKDKEEADVIHGCSSQVEDGTEARA